jgi:ABC-type polysaccharide/polyol phosphate export permease
VGISLGMFISTVSKTKMEANQLFFAFFIIIFLFSGMFIPINSMPSYLQIFANAMPLAHGSPMIQSIVAKGKTVFGPDFRYLIIQGLVLTGLSFINILRKDYEV